MEMQLLHAGKVGITFPYEVHNSFSLAGEIGESRVRDWILTILFRHISYRNIEVLYRLISLRPARPLGMADIWMPG